MKLLLFQISPASFFEYSWFI